MVPWLTEAPEEVVPVAVTEMTYVPGAAFVMRLLAFTVPDELQPVIAIKLIENTAHTKPAQRFCLFPGINRRPANASAPATPSGRIFFAKPLRFTLVSASPVLCPLV